jgi:transketolase
MDTLAINTIRLLAADTVQKANSGHPGAPMGMAPVAHLLWSELMQFDPTCPEWHNRDRFVLSNGHASALIYTMLHLSGYPEMTIDQLKSFRQWGSLTPGHPECHITKGVEVTTGPLGQGISNAVGMAIAEAHLAATFNRPGFDVVDHHTYAFLGDGCLMEGVAMEAISLAGHLKLEKLVAIYDDNHISIDGSTNLAFTDNTVAKFQAQGWHTIVVENGDSDLAAIRRALAEAKNGAGRGKPTLIALRTTIGFLSKVQGTEKAHGAPLGAPEIARIKTKLGMDPTKSFHVGDDVYAVYKNASNRGKAAHAAWVEKFVAYSAQHPELAAAYKAAFAREMPAGLIEALPKNDKPVATRAASQSALATLLPRMPFVVGGSADLTHSNLTRPAAAKLGDFQPGKYGGRYISFGVREHAMGAILNGIDAHGGLIGYGGTFLNFIGYALGSVRLSALSHHGVIYVATHDSIGLGEDGPTHQPVEIVPALRAMPNLLVMRPADQNETSAAWAIALEHRRTPTVLCLSRQAAKPLARSSLEGVRKGAYPVHEAGASKAAIDVVIISTGTEVALCIDAANLYAAQNPSQRVRVVSMPCWELFDQQTVEYQKSVLPDGAAILSVEPMAPLGWSKYSHHHLGLEAWGASAPDKVIYEKYGFTAKNIASVAGKLQKSLKSTGGVLMSRRSNL